MYEEAANDETWTMAMSAEEKGDLHQALKIYEDLSSAGEYRATYKVGSIYERGGVGFPRDASEAAKWYRKAIFSSDYSRAHLALARLIFNGEIEGHDLPQSFYLHAIAASKHGELFSSYMLGQAFEKGRLVEKDMEKALHHYQVAGNGGLIVARKRVAALEAKRGNLLKALFMFLSALRDAARLSSNDPYDPRLAGLKSK